MPGLPIQKRKAAADLKFFTMPIKIKTDLEFGQVMYLKADEDQFEHRLTAVILMPGNQFKFRLSYNGEETEVWDFEVSTEKDELKATGAN